MTAPYQALRDALDTTFVPPLRHALVEATDLAALLADRDALAAVAEAARQVRAMQRGGRWTEANTDKLDDALDVVYRDRVVSKP